MLSRSRRPQDDGVRCGDYVTDEELDERAKTMIEVVYPVIAEMSKARGLQICLDADEGRRMRKGVIPDGTSVHLMNNTRKDKADEWYDGPFIIKGFDDKKKSYTVEDVRGNKVKMQVKSADIKVDCFQDSEEDVDEAEGVYEVRKVLAHRGEDEQREYLVKWKGYKEESWVPTSDFNEYRSIADYWRRERKRRKGSVDGSGPGSKETRKSHIKITGHRIHKGDLQYRVTKDGGAAKWIRVQGELQGAAQGEEEYWEDLEEEE